MYLIKIPSYYILFKNPFDKHSTFTNEKQDNPRSYFHQLTADYNSFVNCSAIFRIIFKYAFLFPLISTIKRKHAQGKTLRRPIS